MKYVGLDNRNYTINPSDYVIYNNDNEDKSQYHIRARLLLKELFPCDIILEEVLLKGSKTSNNKNLRADFLIPARKLMVEVHGQQHYQSVGHFYQTPDEFHRAVMRDKTKSEWAEKNNISLIVLPYNEDNDEWRKRLC